jgi:N-acyl-L-homoserine lactone synthetase
MVKLVTFDNRSQYGGVLEGMHRDRKSVFVEQLKWSLPCDGPFERDQFDDSFADYLIALDPTTGEHLGSMRLLRTDRPHILGSLFPFLCEESVPTGHDVREITRLCIPRRLKAAERRLVFHRLVAALVEYAQLRGVAVYTAVTSIHWLTQTVALGWRCEPIGLPRTIDDTPVCAMRIHIEANTMQLLRKLQTHFATVKLLIIDELGYVPFTAVGAELLFEILSQRYERASTLITSNLPFDEWTSVFSSERLTGDLLDRLTHHVNILEINGESYRLASSRKRQKKSKSDGNEEAAMT